MISLARHIELLLLEHDCVIVPGLGGFIANHAEARYSGDDEHLFLPPYRTIGFNQQLQVNDGLLVQSYMAAYDASYPAAHLQMEKEIEKMMNELEMTGEYTLENIGLLKKDLNQNITFTAPENGILTPHLYGLYSCEIKSLQSVIKEKEIEQALQAAATVIPIDSKKVTQPKNEEKKSNKHVIIRLNRHWLDAGIAAAVAILLFFCFSYPALKTISNETDTVVAAFSPMEEMMAKPQTTPQPAIAIRNNRPAKAEKTPAAEVKPASPKEETVSEEKKLQTNEANNVAEPKAQAVEPKFAIVLASYVSQHNAEMYIENLAKAGFAEGRFVKNGKVSRILYAGYTTEEEAQKALISLRQQSKEFAEAWVLEL